MVLKIVELLLERTSKKNRNFWDFSLLNVRAFSEFLIFGKNNILICLDIICSFANFGRWPSYPVIYATQISQLGGQVFALDDYGMRNYCFGIFSLTHCYRPVPGIFYDSFLFI